jgi:DNA-binding beta-propeller fold protein YncE
MAKKRFLPGVGPGLRAVKRGADGNYYVLSAPGSSASVFDAAGKLVKRVPPYEASTGPTPQSPLLSMITFGEDLDVDAQGTVYVADRGANAVKMWDSSGNARSVKVNGPVSVASLPDGEFAVATVREDHLVIVFDKNGRDVREFGDPEPISERPEVNRSLNMGMLLTDGAGHLYYAFAYLPEATVRQYDRYGYAGQDIQYTGLEAWPAAQATRKEIERQEKRGDSPVFRRILTAVGVERTSGEVWMALGNNLLRFDKEGTRRATYKIYTPEGARLEANTILIEDNRLIIGSDPLGLYEFERPGKKSQQ